MATAMLSAAGVPDTVSGQAAVEQLSGVLLMRLGYSPAWCLCDMHSDIVAHWEEEVSVLERLRSKAGSGKIKGEGETAGIGRMGGIGPMKGQDRT